MQSKFNSLRQKALAAVAAVVILSLVLSVLTFISFADNSRSAAAVDTSQYSPVTETEVTNGDFGDPAGSDLVNTPTSWTGTAITSVPEGSVISGTINLSDLDNDDLEELELDGPVYTPFGKNNPADEFAGSDAYALLINSGGADIAYGYDSASISLSANSYYAISVWVRTSDFSDGEGASIKLSGMDNDIIIEDIDTVDYYGDGTSYDASNHYGWVEYEFYVATSTMSAPSVTISLQLGSSIKFTDQSGAEQTLMDTAKGWALFDHVTAKQYAPSMFESLTASVTDEHNFRDVFADRTYKLSDDGTALLYSENDSAYLSVDAEGNLLDSDDAGYADGEIGSFDGNGNKGWQAAPQSYDKFFSDTGYYGSVREDMGINDSEDIPYSPEGPDNDIFVISSPYNENTGAFSSASAGFATSEFKIERRKNYRLGVWVKTVVDDHTSDDAIAGIAIRGTDYRGPLEDNDDPANNGKGQLLVTSSGLAGDPDNTSRYGWSEEVFYIKGSDFADYTISLELWLGMCATSDAAATSAAGIALFDNIRIEEISNSEYTSNSSNGTTVTFDAASADLSINNGSFNEIEDIVRDKDGNDVTPYTPSDWTLMAAGEDGTTGMSGNVYNENYRDYVVGGVVSSDMTEYNYRAPGTLDTVKGQINPALKTESLPDNLLMIEAKESRLPTDENKGVAVGYRSLSFSVSANTVQRIDIKMRTENAEGYGANLALKNGDKEVATIQRITDTGSAGYKTYSFFVQTGDSSLSEMYVEIWLGFYDDEDNTTKLATGTVYVSEVSMTQLNAMTEDADGNETTNEASLNEQREEFAAKQTAYKASMNDHGIIPDFACYSTYGSTIDSYNNYDDDFFKTPYNWTLAESSSSGAEGVSAVSFGAFDAGSADESGAALPSSYTRNNAVNDDSLAIKNALPAYSKVTGDVTYTLNGGSYYKLTVVMQAIIPIDQLSDKYKGAYIAIDDTEYGLFDVKTTKNDNGESEFQEFSIYIHTDGTAPTESDSEDEETESGTTKSMTVAFGIGGNAVSEYARGTLIINDISLETIESSQFEDARSEIENSGAIASSHNAIADYTGGEQETTEEDTDTPSDTDESGNDWYIYISVVLAVVILIAVVAAIVRYLAIRRKRNGGASASGKLSYDRETTLRIQHNERAGEDEGILPADAYEAFDEDIEDAIEMKKALAEAEALAAENRGETVDANAEVPAEEVPASPESPASEADGTEPAAEDTATEASAEAEATDETVTAEETNEPKADETPSAESAERVTETENAEAAPDAESEDDTYLYSDEIVDFTPSEERRRELEEARAEKARRKAEKEAARKAEEETRARLEAERREATRRYNKWDDFED